MTIDGLNPLTTLTAGDELPVWDAEASAEEPTKKITAQNMANSVKTLANLQGSLTFDTTPTTGSTNPVTSGGVADAIAQSTALLNTIEDHQITRVGSYFTERSSFKARRLWGTVIIFSYVQITTQVPANTAFADIGISNAEGIFSFVSGGTSHIVTCSGGILKPDAALPTGYYYVVGSALARYT